jgi:hypothetical protein
MTHASRATGAGWMVVEYHFLTPHDFFASCSFLERNCELTPPLTVAGTLEAAMDDHTHQLLNAADEKIRRIAIKIEQQRLHIVQLHPSRRCADVAELKILIGEHSRLQSYRKALLEDPPRNLMN